MGKAQDELDKWRKEHGNVNASFAPKELVGAAWMENNAPNNDYDAAVAADRGGYATADHYAVIKREQQDPNATSVSGDTRKRIVDMRKSAPSPVSGYSSYYDYWQNYKPVNTPTAGAGPTTGPGGTPVGSLFGDQEQPKLTGNPFAAATHQPGGRAGVVDASKVPGGYQDWAQNFDPFDPGRWQYGWGNLIKGAGINPFGNNPFQRFLADPDVYQPYALRWIAQQALNGQNLSDPMAVQSQFKDFLGGGMTGLGGGQSMLAALKQKFNEALTGGSALLGGTAGAFVDALKNDDKASRYLGAIMSAGMTPAAIRARMAQMNLLRNKYEMEGGSSGADNFAQWFLGNYA